MLSACTYIFLKKNKNKQLNLKNIILFRKKICFGQMFERIFEHILVPHIKMIFRTEIRGINFPGLLLNSPETYPD